jgi:putative polyhydroxyalkanoate system protein
MADIDVHRVHNLGLAAARAAAEKMEAHLGRKFDLRGAWHGNVLKFERPGVSGLLTIGEKDMNLSVTLGFLLKAMRGSIEAAVRHELDDLFPEGAPPAKAAPATPKKAAPKPKKGG